ncbi:MAG: T9SS type A sorting domain-containing protein, partial [Ferruginibacter sp.]|nr:T9SS type A sorting domain-containing protein [Chitinophagaceae bacterium]
ILLGLNLDITLPVTLLHFSATKENASSKITWTTTQETNSREFVVERSVNGANSWQIIATLPAAGNSTTPVDYIVYDPAPAKGTNLYRLKSTNLDNQFEYSAIRRVNFDNKYTYSIYPNPVMDRIWITTDHSSPATATVQIVNTSGHLLLTKQINSNSQPSSVNVSTLPSGMYVIKIIEADGTVNVQKFTKQ